MKDEKEIRWVTTGIAAGFATCVIYPLVTIAPLPRLALVVLASILGPSLAVASIGLRAALRFHKKSLLIDLGALFNVLAGLLLGTMLLVQLAVRLHASGAGIDPHIIAVWLGLDVAWDVYIGLGTGCFAIAMMRHPRFGKTMGITGVALAVIVLACNLSTFPVPPAEAGLVDVGPAVGLWYLAATIILWRSLPWLKAQAASHQVPPAT